MFSGDHIVPNFEEIWPSNKDKSDKYKRRLIGMEYYMDAMENHGLKGHLPQPDNFTTCGKLGIEINQYNCPIEVTPFRNNIINNPPPWIILNVVKKVPL